MADNLNIKNPSVRQGDLDLRTDASGNIVSISGHPIAGGGGGGGTTYTPGQYINIDSNNEISVTGVVASDEYATYSGDWNDVSNSYKTNSGSFLTNEDLTNYATKTYVDSKDPVLIGDSNITATSTKVDGHTQWNLAVNVTPVVTDTKLVGDNCVTAHTTQTSGEWKIGLEQSAYEAIDSIDGISTDVGTLKTASAGWDKVSDKLDTTAFSTVSGSFLTAHQSLEDYATKSDINDMATQTWVSEQGYITQETDWTNTIQEASAKAYNDATANANSLYQAKGDYVKNTDIGLDSNNKVTAISGKELIITAHQSLTNYYTKSETSGATQLSTEFGKYLTTAQYNIDSATFALKSDLNGLVNSASVTTNDNYVMTNTGWKVLTLPGGGMTQVYHDTTLTGDGNANDNQLGVAWSALSGNTIASALSADVAMYYYDTVDNMPIGISTTINGIYNALDNYLLTGDIMPDNGISGNYISQAQQFELGLTQTAYNAVTSVSSKLDTTAAAQTYLTKTDYAADSATFLTGVVTGVGLSGTGLSNSPLGIDTGASIYFTNGSAKSAISADKAASASASKRLQSSTAGPVIQAEDVTALQNWASSNSSTWNDVTAKLGTAQYALDSATFVTSSSNTITGTKQYALTTAGWSDIGLSNYLPLSGGTVSGDVIVKSTGKNLLAVNTTATLMGQSRVANLTDTTAIGTNWLGVNSLGGGFLKNVQGGNVGDLNGTSSIQINFASDGANSYGNITVNSQDNVSKVVHIPTASYNSMSSFDNTNGPNYMLRKTASGFDIGAAVINVTSLPQQIEANAYYFVYDV